MTPYGGHVLLADTSAWHRARDPSVLDEWFEAYDGGQIATCAVVALELMYSARDATEADRIDDRLALLRDVPLGRSVTRAGLRAMRDLARIRPLHHRVPSSDVLIAAAAAEVGIGVLHYDRHYDRLAEVLPFESRWIAPPGTL